MNGIRIAHARLSPASRGASFYFMFFAAWGIMAPFLNVYFRQQGLSGRQIGSLAVVSPLMTVLLAPALAAMADRHQRRRSMLVISTLASVAAVWLLGTAHHFVTFALFILLLAVVRSPSLPIADGLIARMAARHRLNYGSMRVWGSIAFATFAVLGGFLWGQLGYQPMFLATALLLLPVAWFGSTLEEGRLPIKRDRQRVGQLLRDRGLLVVLLATILAGIAFGLTMQFEGILMDALGGSEFLIGALLGVSATSEIPTMVSSDQVARRLGGTRPLLLAYGLIGVACLGYALAMAPEMMLLFAVSKGLAFGLSFTSTVRWMDARVPEELSSTAQSLTNASFFGLAMLIAGPLGGEILDRWGAGAIFWVAACMALAGILTLALALKRRLVS